MLNHQRVNSISFNYHFPLVFLGYHLPRLQTQELRGQSVPCSVLWAEDVEGPEAGPWDVGSKPIYVKIAFELI